MSRWPKVRLSECLQLINDTVPVQRDQEYPNFGIYSYARGLFRKRPIIGLESSATTLRRVRKRQFIYSRLFAFEGAYGIVGDEFDGFFVSNEYPTFICDEARLMPQYLLAYFSMKRVWEAVARGSKGLGVRRQRVQPEEILGHEIPLAPLDVQRSIVSRLERVVAKAREVACRLDAIGADAVSFIVSQHHALAGERVVRLGDILDLHEVPEPVLPAGSYPQVGVKGFGGGLFSKAAIMGTETTYRSFNRLYTNALVLSQVKGWEGALAVCPKELDGKFVSPEYRTFRCREGHCAPGYLSELVRTSWFWKQLLEATRGVGARRERTRPEQFLALEVPMPAFDDQIKAIASLSRLSRMKAKHTTIRRDLDVLLPTMLERIFQSERCSP